MKCPRNMNGRGRHHFTSDGTCTLCDLNAPAELEVANERIAALERLQSAGAIERATKLPGALMRAQCDLLSWMPTPGALDELPGRKKSVTVKVHVDDIRNGWRLVDETVEAANEARQRILATQGAAGGADQERTRP